MKKSKMNGVDISEFGFHNGKKIECISLRNGMGSELQLITLGATWHSFTILDSNDNFNDVLVGPKTLEGHIGQYDLHPYYFGTSVGRYAGRISNGEFHLNGQNYPLDKKDGIHLHGGAQGLHSKIWKIDMVNGGQNPSITLSCASIHLEGGYPGNVSFGVTYRLSENNEVEITYTANTDRDTFLNLTNHAYFNLGTDSILNHEFEISSDTTLEMDENLIPTGKLQPINGSAYDFTSPEKLKKIEAIEGLDNYYVFKEVTDLPQIRLYSPKSGIELKVMTNQPGAVIFTPIRLNFSGVPKNRKKGLVKFPAICLETQCYQNAPNVKAFPSSLITPNQNYMATSVYSFSIKKV